jgi:hypothetical protein
LDVRREGAEPRLELFVCKFASEVLGPPGGREGGGGGGGVGEEGGEATDIDFEEDVEAFWGGRVRGRGGGGAAATAAAAAAAAVVADTAVEQVERDDLVDGLAFLALDGDGFRDGEQELDYFSLRGRSEKLTPEEHGCFSVVGFFVGEERVEVMKEGGQELLVELGGARGVELGEEEGEVPDGVVEESGDGGGVEESFF